MLWFNNLPIKQRRRLFPSALPQGMLSVHFLLAVQKKGNNGFTTAFSPKKQREGRFLRRTHPWGAVQKVQNLPQSTRRTRRMNIITSCLAINWNFLRALCALRGEHKIILFRQPLQKGL